MLGRRGNWVLSLVALGVLAGCEPSRGEVRDWRPEDHDQPQQNAQQTAQPNRAAPRPKRPDEDRGERVWMATCASCHGPQGKGDGPMGKSTGAPDLTRDEWLGAVTDEQIAAVIRSGKGAMPPNPNMPDSTVKMLVARIRGKGR